MKYNIFEVVFVLTFFITGSFDNTFILLIGTIIMGICTIFIRKNSKEDDEYEYIDESEEENCKHHAA